MNLQMYCGTAFIVMILFAAIIYSFIALATGCRKIWYVVIFLIFGLIYFSFSLFMINQREKNEQIALNGSPERQIQNLQRTLDAQNRQMTVAVRQTQYVIDMDLTRDSQLATIDVLQSQLDTNSQREIATLEASITEQYTDEIQNQPPVNTLAPNVAPTIVALRQIVAASSSASSIQSTNQSPVNKASLITDPTFQWLVATFVAIVGTVIAFIALYVQIRQK